MTPTGLSATACNGFDASSISPRFRGLDDEQLVEFARAGNARATEYLLSKYSGFVQGKARSYFLSGAEPDDVVQEGMIGLYKAIRDYRAGRLSRFRTFAELCVTRQIITAVKSATRNKHAMLSECLSLESTGDGNDVDGRSSLLELIADSRMADPEKILLERRALGWLRSRARQDLSVLEWNVLQGYLQGATYQEMARSFGKPAKTIDNALQRAKRKFGHRLNELN